VGATPSAFKLVAYAPSHAPAAAELHSLVLPISPSTLDQQLRLPAVASLTETAVIEGRSVGLLDIRTTDGERFSLRLFVDPRFQRMGLGSRLLGRAVSSASSRFPGATVRATLRDEDDAALKWAQRRGFEEYARSISMSRELPEDAQELESAAEAARERAGVTIEQWLSTSNGDDWRWLTDLLSGCMSGSLHSGVGKVNEEMARYLVPYPEGVLVAFRDDRQVGMASIAPEGPSSWYSWFTGVLPEARGKGVAVALKAGALALARRQGAEVMRTNNDVLNLPVIGLNETLGYRREPGLRRLHASISDVRAEGR
jgi:GNAT superfamily N-acetyltransferase